VNGFIRVIRDRLKPGLQTKLPAAGGRVHRAFGEVRLDLFHLLLNARSLFHEFADAGHRIGLSKIQDCHLSSMLVIKTGVQVEPVICSRLRLKKDVIFLVERIELKRQVVRMGNDHDVKVYPGRPVAIWRKAQEMKITRFLHMETSLKVRSR
jgi:hypothetical protein